MVSIYDVDVECGDCSEPVSVDPPKNRIMYAVVLATILGTIGLIFGLTVGIATAGFGMAATPFTAVIGAYVGYRAGDWISEMVHGVRCPGCGYNFS